MHESKKFESKEIPILILIAVNFLCALINAQELKRKTCVPLNFGRKNTIKGSTNGRLVVINLCGGIMSNYKETEKLKSVYVQF